MIFFVVLAFLFTAAILFLIGGHPLAAFVLYDVAFVVGIALA